MYNFESLKLITVTIVVVASLCIVRCPDHYALVGAGHPFPVRVALGTPTAFGEDAIQAARFISLSLTLLPSTADCRRQTTVMDGFCKREKCS